MSRHVQTFFVSTKVGDTRYVQHVAGVTKKGLKKAPKKARGKLVNELFASLFLLSSKKILLDTSSYFTVSFFGEISPRAMRNADVTTTSAMPNKQRPTYSTKLKRRIKKDLKGVTKEN